MKKLAKLALLFTTSFAILLLVSTGIRFLVMHVEWVRMLSLQQEAVLTAIKSAARWALSLGLYGGIILGLSYAVRREIPAPLAILCIAVLAIGIVCGVSMGLKSQDYVPPAKTLRLPLGGPGLMLSNTAQPTGTVLVLLQGPAEPGGRRVVVSPGIPLLYQAEFIGRDPSLISLPPVPLNIDSPWILRSIAIDLRLNAENLHQRLDESLLSFLIYTAALIFLLSSLMFIFNLSLWPLANLLLGCLAFRGILALETFLNSPEIQDVFGSFLQNSLPLSLTVPLIFCGIGLLIHLYSILIFLAKKRGTYGI